VYLNASFSKKVQSISDYGEIGFYNRDLKSKLSNDSASTSPTKLNANNLKTQFVSSSSGHNMTEKLRELEKKYVKPIFSKKEEDPVKSIDLQEYKENIDKLSHYEEFWDEGGCFNKFKRIKIGWLGDSNNKKWKACNER